MDSFGRVIDYLRISVTDRCNERCLYCMPQGYRGWQRSPDHLTTDELLRVVRVAAGMGFRKFRLTGGEPLLRADLVKIVRGIAAIPGVACIGLSTNGTRLASLAGPLREAGLRTVNVSLDALDPARYRRVTGGNIALVLAGLRAALAAGFERVKLNAVLMRGVNECEIWPLVLFAAEHDLPLRLIELMPITSSRVLQPGDFFSIEEARSLIAERDELVPVPSLYLGWGPAKYYRLRQTGALVGFIGAMTTPHFCETCNKLRLTADGRLRPCLGDHGEVELRSVLRSPSSDDDLRECLDRAIRLKPLAHRMSPGFTPCRPMPAIGG